ncbi:PTS fructose transporter subunit IIB [Clostridiaceae bacterium M8S5]|nr:PTS fructose transporter subunit IIB [Clostridiaceae bacterium M8S5]
MRIVGVTACPTGVAHTFMAKKALENAAEKLGHSIKIETQGATGVENKLTKEDIESADVVILAIGIDIPNKDRFKGARVVEIPVATAMKSPETLIKKIEEKL